LKISFLLVAAIAAAATSCTGRSEKEVPNFLRIDAGVMRSGHPPMLSWPHLADLGVTDVIKLDFDDEGLDTGALASNIRVHYVPLQPAAFLGIELDPFSEPDRSTLQEIHRLVTTIRDLPTRTWLVHCSNGRDRTGLVAGMIRVIVDGWDKRRAWQEMLDRGYHPELLGLDRAWWEFSPQETPP